mmetsp:Transcript_7332/g.15996  ORF Transcript_7332/g.15996 Transcript_7332/m.15996 type:complete len:383 (-) Transcript_7332:1724-2872(-)
MAPSKQKKSKAKKATVRDPRAKPKRPLSAYNLFFQYERDLLLQSKPSKKGQSHDEMHRTILNNPSERRNRSKTVRPPPHGKIGFAELARMIGKKWKTLDDTSLEHFQGLAAIEKKRYVKECSEWKARMKREAELEESEAAAQKAAATAAEVKDQSRTQDRFGGVHLAPVAPVVEASVASVAPIQEGSLSNFDGFLPLDDEDFTFPPVSTTFQQGQQQVQQGQSISQQQVYSMLDRACEIAGGGFNTPLPAHFTTGIVPLNSHFGGVSSSPYGSQQQHERFHAEFAPPVVNASSHPHYESVGQYEPSQLAPAPFKVTDMYQKPWGAPPKTNLRDAQNCVAKPPRVVSGGSTHESAGDSLGSGFDSATTFDGDILDLLSRIVAD